MLGSSSSNRVNNTNEKDLVGWSSANKQEQERDYLQWGGTGTQAINRNGNKILEARRIGWSFSRPDLACLAPLTPSVGAWAVNMPAGKAERIGVKHGDIDLKEVLWPFSWIPAVQLPSCVT